MTGASSLDDGFGPTVSAIIGKRAEQQDSAAATRAVVEGRSGLLLLLADGMGGAAGGGTASRVAIEAASAEFESNVAASVAERLKAALTMANRAVADTVVRDASLSGMGTTLIAAFVIGRSITWISVGDSLLLAVRHGRLQRLNADHSLGGDLDNAARAGSISKSEAARSPQRHMLRSAVIGAEIRLVDEGSTVLDPGTRLVMASDGLLTLSMSEVARLASGAKTATAINEALITAVEADMPSDQDNLTIVTTIIPDGQRSRSLAMPMWATVLLSVSLATIVGLCLFLILNTGSPAPLTPRIDAARATADAIDRRAAASDAASGDARQNDRTPPPTAGPAPNTTGNITIDQHKMDAVNRRYDGVATTSSPQDSPRSAASEPTARPLASTAPAGGSKIVPAPAPAAAKGHAKGISTADPEAKPSHSTLDEKSDSAAPSRSDRDTMSLAIKPTGPIAARVMS